jgi:hypothetical protein
LSSPTKDYYGAATKRYFFFFFKKKMASCQMIDRLIDVGLIDAFFTAWDALPNDKKASPALT